MACTSLTSAQFAFGYALVVGTFFLVYLPQWIKLIRQRSHRGLSLTNFCFASFSTHLSLITIICQTSEDVLHCCANGSAHECAATSQPLIQQFTTSVGALIVPVLYAWYFDACWVRSRGEDPEPEWKSTKQQLIILFSSDVVTAAIAIAMFITKSEDAVHKYARFTSVLNALIICFHWTFQLRETYSVKSAGSLSLFSLFVMSTGCIAAAYNYSLHGTWLLWAPYLVSAAMIWAVFSLATYYECYPLNDDAAEAEEYKPMEAEDDSAGNASELPCPLSFDDEDMNSKVQVQKQHQKLLS